MPRVMVDQQFHIFYYNCFCSLWWKFKNYTHIHTLAWAYGFCIMYFDTVSNLKVNPYYCFIPVVKVKKWRFSVNGREKRLFINLKSYNSRDHLQTDNIFIYLKYVFSVSPKCKTLSCSCGIQRQIRNSFCSSGMCGLDQKRTPMPTQFQQSKEQWGQRGRADMCFAIQLFGCYNGKLRKRRELDEGLMEEVVLEVGEEF